jgi:hypothetical protein
MRTCIPCRRRAPPPPATHTRRTHPHTLSTHPLSTRPPRRPQIRETDLDALERVAACVTWGDLAADDPRHLTETDFTKVFRLAQLLVEYLLHVQVGGAARCGGCRVRCAARVGLSQGQVYLPFCSPPNPPITLCNKKVANVNHHTPHRRACSTPMPSWRRTAP